MEHSIGKIPDPKFRAYVRQRLLDDYVAQLWRHTYLGVNFAKSDFVALGEDVERLFGGGKQRSTINRLYRANPSLC